MTCSRRSADGGRGTIQSAKEQRAAVDRPEHRAGAAGAAARGLPEPAAQAVTAAEGSLRRAERAGPEAARPVDFRRLLRLYRHRSGRCGATGTEGRTPDASAAEGAEEGVGH